MGTLFVFLWVPNQAPPKSPKAFILNGLGRFFAKTEKHNFKDMERTSTGHRKTKRESDKCVHYKNGGAPSIGKLNTGA